MAQRPDIQRPLRWLMIIRVVVATTLMISAFVIELIFRPEVTLQPFYLPIGLAYLLSLLYSLLFPRFKNSPAFALLQIVGDVIITSGFVYITGGVLSAFSFLYILSIITASILLYRRGAMLVACLSWVFYAALVLLTFYGIVHTFPTPDTQAGMITEKQVSYALFAHLLAFLAVGFLSSTLSEKLLQAGVELQEQRKHLEALQALHKNIIESIASGIVTTDLDGKITFLNKAAEQITGHSYPLQLRRPIASFLDEPSDFLTGVSETLPGSRKYRFEKPYHSADGRDLYLGITVSVLRERGGTPRGYTFIFQDLTEIKALEEELRLKDRMSVLGRMAAGVAHELRNPLAAMAGSVQILGQELELEGQQSELMQVILDESLRLERTIREFLQFARPRRFQPEKADLAQVLSESVVLLRNSEEFKHHHSIKTDFEPQEVHYVFDVDQMKQIFWNLAKNSLKAMPEGGELTLRITQASGRGPEISFSDQGVGMDPSQVQRCFQPFETSFEDGTGLGLAIVYRNVQEHGGRLSVHSAPDKGSCFTIHLPAEPMHVEVAT
ncbi:MAG: PAS domain S-box protein [Acidobacteria bacterium]|nr:MAG: PAS domain S-box protein [Acidobacteriota bacterium]